MAMEYKKDNGNRAVEYMVLRCPLVKFDAHRCHKLCTPAGGFGLCGRPADHEPREDRRARSVYFVITGDKAA
jgi:hypothetical protein